MKPVIIRDMNRCYLVVENEEGQESGFQQKMVLHNKLPGLLEVERRQIDESFKYYYDVTNKISLREIFSKSEISAKKIEFIISSIIKIIQDAMEFLLEQDNFILLPDYIYLDSSRESVYLCFYESYCTNVREQMVKLAEYFMEVIDYKDERAVTLTYGLYKVLRENSCNFATVTEVIEQSRNDVVFKQNIGEVMQQQSIELVEQRETKYYESDSLPFVKGMVAVINILIVIILLKTRFFFFESSWNLNIKHVASSCLLLAIGNSLVFYIQKKFLVLKQDEIPFQDVECDDTIVLANYHPLYVLKGEMGCGNINIQSFPCIIGSDKKQVNEVVQSPAVSKRHAILEEVNGKIHIRDLSSTNGTFINGELLTNNSSYPLSDKDKITFANVTYQLIKIS